MKRFLEGLSLLGTIVIASVVGASPAASANLLSNPGFETGGGSYSGWFTFGGGVQLSLPSGDNIIRTGAAASKTYGGFTGCPSLPSFNVGGYGQAFTPVAGKVYTLSGYSYIAAADPIPGTTTCTKNRMLAKIAFFNAAVGGTELSANEARHNLEQERGMIHRFDLARNPFHADVRQVLAQPGQRAFL